MTSNVIEKLNLLNYATWGSDTKYLMLERGIWEIIEKNLQISEVSATVTTKMVNAFIVRRNQALSLYI